MANENGSKTDPLIEMLESRGFDFDFFQASRRIECAHKDKPRIGCSSRFDEDPILFCQDVSLAFAPSAIVGCKKPEEGPLKMLVSFFGLSGTNGPMPAHITEYVRSRLRNHGDNTLANFLDIFNHRMISLFYRAWSCNQQNLSFDREDDEDRFAVYIGSLFGIGEESFRNRDSLDDVAKLHYSGHLVCQNRTCDGLRATLEDYFGVPVEIEEFVGQWIDIPEDCQCKMGDSAETGSLGESVIVGSRFW